MCKANQTVEDVIHIPAEQIGPVLEPVFCFPAAVYTVKLPQFLDAAKTVVTEAISVKKKEIKKLNEIYPLVMTDNLHTDLRLADLTAFVGQTAWNIFDGQGYAMQNMSTYFTEFWCQ